MYFCYGLYREFKSGEREDTEHRSYWQAPNWTVSNEAFIPAESLVFSLFAR